MTLTAQELRDGIRLETAIELLEALLRDRLGDDALVDSWVLARDDAALLEAAQNIRMALEAGRRGD